MTISLHGEGSRGVELQPCDSRVDVLRSQCYKPTQPCYHCLTDGTANNRLPSTQLTSAVVPGTSIKRQGLSLSTLLA